MTSLSLSVKSRGKPIRTLPARIVLQSSDPTEHLYEEVANTSGYSINRLRISLAADGSQVVPNAGQTLADAGISPGADVFVKDLGPQIDWRTVYVIEYIGALIIHPLLYKLRLADPTPAQTLTLAMVCIQFIKRELETLFVHRFSLATMPVRNIFKNSFHYWVLGGLMIAWFVYAPTEAQPLDAVSYLGVLFFGLGVSLNTHIHLLQRSLRPAGTTERRIPSGIFFSLVTCPNYTFEVLTWTGVLLVCRNWSVAVFLVVSIVQMKLWADKKERRYRKEFPSTYVPKRCTILPGIM